MSLLVNIVEQAALVGVGAGLCYLLLWWKGRNLKRVKTLEAEALLAKGRTEAEITLRDARLAANEEARKLREQADQALAARRAERLELERRLAEREALINSQLARLVEVEKGLNEQKEALSKQANAIESRQRELAELTRQELEQLQKLGRLSEAEARAEFLKRIEQTALQDANNLTRSILEEAKTKAEERARQII